MLLGQRHGGVEANDREAARDLQDALDHGLAHLGIQVVQLCRVVPGIAGAVVAVINVARVAGPTVQPAKHHGRVGAIVVVIFDLDLHPAVVGQIGAIERVGGIGA